MYSIAYYSWGAYREAEDFYKEGVGGEFKIALAMWLKAKGFPDAMHSGPGQIGFFRHRANRPVCTTYRFDFESFADQSGYLFIRNGSRPACSQLVMKA